MHLLLKVLHGLRLEDVSPVGLSRADNLVFNLTWMHAAGPASTLTQHSGRNAPCLTAAASALREHWHPVVDWEVRSAHPAVGVASPQLGL